MTPAGSQFTTSLRGIRDELRKAIEQGQNFSTQYQENIRIVLPIRSALYFLPEAIRNVAAGRAIVLSPGLCSLIHSAVQRIVSPFS